MRALQARFRDDKKGHLAPTDERLTPVDIIQPKTYPSVNAQALKLMLTPYAIGAKLWSQVNQLGHYPDEAVSARDLHRSVVELFAAPGNIAADCWNLAFDAARWALRLPYSDR